jgi:molecular chaperone DnaJ
VTERAAKLAAVNRPNQLSAKFSIPYALAAYLVRGDSTAAAFAPGALADESIRRLADRVEVTASSGLSARWPDEAPAEVEIELADAARGVKREVPFPVAVTCKTCAGSGAAPGTSPVVCETCGGAGRLQRVSRSAFGEFVRTQTCPACRGAGQRIDEPCPECRGEGRTIEERTLEVEIPPGIHDGQQIRISGEGHAGGGGGRAGDAYVGVRIGPDPRFVREGDDIFSTVDLTITEAALGTTVTVPTLDGDVELEFPEGTQPGEIRVLRGRGMPVLQGFGRGDQRVLVNVAVPRRLNDEQRRLLAQFAASADDETYRVDEGFFEKLKSAFR